MRGWGKSETQTVLDRDRILGTRCPSILQESICFPHQKTFYLSGRSVEKGGGGRYRRSELTQTWSGGSIQKVGELLSVWVDDKDWHRCHQMMRIVPVKHMVGLSFLLSFFLKQNPDQQLGL